MEWFPDLPWEYLTGLNCLLRGRIAAPINGAQQSHRMQELSPLAFVPIGAASGDILQVAGIYQARPHAAPLENLVQRNPPGRRWRIKGSSMLTTVRRSNGMCQVICVNGQSFFEFSIPGRLNGPERGIGRCGDATRAPAQWPGFRDGELITRHLGPGILAQKR